MKSVFDDEAPAGQPAAAISACQFDESRNQEFAILLDNCSPARARDIGNEMLQSLNPLPVEWRGVSHSIGASIGVSLLSDEMANIGDWVAAADRACYTAKRGGRGRLHMEPAARAG